MSRAGRVDRQLLAACVAAVVLATPTLAAGAVFARSGSVSVTQIHAAIVLEDNLTTLVLQLGLEGSGGDLAWVVPTTGLATALQTEQTPEDAPPDAFARLHEVTAARQVRLTERRRDLGCTAIGKLSEELVAPPAWAAYSLTSRNARAFDRAASDGVVSWLAGRGYAVSPAADALLTTLIAEERFFTVIELGGVRPLGAAADLATAASPPMVVLRGSQRVVPLLLAQLTAAAPVELLLYVIGPGRHAVQNYATTELRVAEWLDGDDLDTWYAAELDRALGEGDEPTFVVEHADSIDLVDVQYVLRREATVAPVGAVDWFVTRLRARLQPAEVIADAEVRLVPGDPANQRHRIRVVDGGTPERAALPGWALLLGIFALARARWSRR